MSQLSLPLPLRAQHYFMSLKSYFMSHELKFIQDNNVYVLGARLLWALEQVQRESGICRQDLAFD